MKKKFLSSVLCILFLGLLCACGSKEEDINPDEYVTLGDYQNLSVEIAYYTYTEDDVQMCIDGELGFYVDSYDLYEYETDISANTVEVGSVVNIDYRGTLDGVAFDGGTAVGDHLLIGSGRFIPGFEDGLIGANVGDTVELNLTFPENYSEELAGKDAVFTVSVNSIDMQVMPAFTDELIASLNFGEDITTYDAFVQYIREYLENSCNEANQYLLEETLWDAAYSVCEISDPPESLVDFYLNDLEEYFESYASYYGMDLESLVPQMGMTMEEFAERNRESAIDEAKIELAYMAIAKAEGIKVDDKKVQEVAEEEYAMYGYTSADDFISNMGTFNFRSYVRRQLVTERLKEEITVVELEPISYLQGSAEE